MSATPSNTLEPLVAAAAGGDRAAFATLVSETSGVVSSIALAIVRDLDVSRDVAQDVFLAAWRDLRKLRNPASFLPWLRQLTRNRAHHVLRTHVRAKRRLGVGDAEAMLETLVDPQPGVTDAMIAAEDRTALAEALAEMPDDTREVLTLFYREGQSTAHVARLLDLDEAAVRKRLSRARATLKASLLERAGRTMETTKLGGSFTAGVMGALPMAATTAGPAAAIAAAKTAIKSGLLVKLALSSAGVLAGAGGGIAGVLFGSRKLLRDARDDDERRALITFTVVSVAVVIGFSIAFPVSWALTHSRIAPVASFLAFIAALVYLQHGWLPRIVARRHEREMREDPLRAAKRRHAERRAAIIGWTLGLTFGTAGLLLGLYLSWNG
ncbi:MAG TPA: sigma-70 family RNA polymerase sigma factor [Vicinamibacterales bacterium]|jgi:RNA polymerase sigma factor (sigma-70 family)|nr:sigma-70 family RNA polymerase sigma factor [Vicinamibacterales bacterium]